MRDVETPRTRLPASRPCGVGKSHPHKYCFVQPDEMSEHWKDSTDPWTNLGEGPGRELVTEFPLFNPNQSRPCLHVVWALQSRRNAGKSCNKRRDNGRRPEVPCVAACRIGQRGVVQWTVYSFLVEGPFPFLPCLSEPGPGSPARARNGGGGMRRRRSTPIYHRPIAARSSWLWLDACVTVLNSSNVSARSRWSSSLDPATVRRLSSAQK